MKVIAPVLPQYRRAMRLRERRSKAATDCALEALLRHAREKVPYYRERVGGSSGHELSDFPILTREELQGQFADLIARDRSGGIAGEELSIIRTGGSTGTPASHIRDVSESSLWDGVLFSRLLEYIAAPPVGVVHDLGLHSGAQPLVEGFVFPPFRYLWFNFRGFFDEEMTAEALAIVGDSRPDVVMGLPSRLLQLAEKAEEWGRPVTPGAVVSSYEQLTDGVRANLEKSFHCRVVNLYGSAEAGLCAWECSDGRLHFETDAVLPEILDDHGRTCPPGEVGRLLVTSLKSTVMPLIRYETGDMAARSPACPCGSDRFAIDRLEGRISARAVTSSGRLVSPYTTLVHIDALNLRHYQVIQDTPGVLRIVTDPAAPAPDTALVDSVSEQLSAWAKERFRIVIESTGEYVLSTTGKRNPFVCRVEPGRS